MHRLRSQRHRDAFTLVETLMAIAIIGMLVALFMPAVQAARESSRRSQCKNNLKQIALACLSHAQAHRHLPTGGWGWHWTGDPDRGFGRNQPGGWVYAVLPYLEQADLREKGQGAPPAIKRSAAREVLETSLPVFNCPSRRAAAPLPYVYDDNFVNADRPQVVGRSDYAANVGDRQPSLYGPGPETLVEGDGKTYKWLQLDRTGVIYRRSEIRPAHIRDGASHTYLVAEAYLDVNHYFDGLGMNDDHSMYVGYDRDTLRTTHPSHPPNRDYPGLAADHSFGSAHPDAFHASFCDGSVRPIRYDISQETHRRQGNRKDGQPVDAPSL